MIKAIEDKVIVIEMKRNQTQAGILIPTTAQDPQAYGRVVSMGPDLEERGQIQIDDILVYHKMGGQAIAMGGKMLCCVPYPEIYGVLQDETLLSELEEIEINAIQPPPETDKPQLITKV